MSDRDARFNDELEAQPIVAQQPVISPSPLPQLPKKNSLASLEEKFTHIHNKLKRTNLFSSFCENPANVTFQTQEQDEKVLLFLRKSKIMNLPWIFATIILVFIPPLLYPLRDSFFGFIPPASFLFVLLPLYYITVAMYAFVNFITWYYNVALITTKRVVDIDFHQLVMKDIAETKLTLVQDVSYRQVGVLENLFGFGHVLIQTAGQVENFEFYQLPQPARVVEVVETLIGTKRFYEP